MSTPAIKNLLLFPRGKPVAGICVFLFAMMVWTFLPTLHNDFINFDDKTYVTENAHVQAGLSRAGIVWAFTSVEASNWHPMTWLSHMVDYDLYGPKPWGHHLTSVLLHALNAVLVFLIFRRMTGATWRSLFVAAIFGLHPLRVESVAWVAERKDVLSTLFGLLTLWMYAEYARCSESRIPKSRIFYGLALFMFAFSLMSKPMLVTLPGVFLLLDYWPLNRLQKKSAGRLAWEKAPFFLLAAASCAITFFAQKNGGALTSMAGIPLLARGENALVSYGRYLGKIFWPENLSVLYPVCDHWPTLTVIFAVLLLLGISAVAIGSRRRLPYLLTGWLWFLGTLVPVIGLVAVGEQSMADRYSYFPSIGILMIIVWGVVELTNQWRHQVVSLSITSGVIIWACIGLTRQHIGYWKDSETLFRHAIAVTGDNYGARSNLGNVLLEQGRPAEALSELQVAVKLQPNSAENHLNFGVALADVGRMAEAVGEFQAATRINPDYAQAHHNLGMALEQKGLLDEATREYAEAVRLLPSFAAAHNSLGIALAKKGRLDEAVQEFQAAIRLDPAYLAAQSNLKMALELKGH